MPENLIGRHARFLLYWVASLVLFQAPLRALIDLSIDDYRYSHLVVIPLIAAFLVWRERTRIFADARYSPRSGALLVGGGLVLYAIARLQIFRASGLGAQVFAIVAVWAAGFFLCYGPRCLKAAAFPWFFLLLFVPAPTGLLDLVIAALQKGSSEIASRLFGLAGVPVFRDGYRFSLPGITIEVAGECSSIRSGTALFITGLLTSHLLLRSGWSRVCLVLLTPAIAVCTNAVRIVSLSTLAVYVDRGFLFGNLHHRGGALFSLLSVAMLILVLFVLRRSEQRVPPAASAVSDSRPNNAPFPCPH